MRLLELQTYQFRNLANQKLEFHRNLNIFIGPNGQGKTNFVEALAVLSTGRSFRTSITKELVRIGESKGSVFGTVEDSSEQQERIGVALAGKEGKQYFIGDKELGSLESYLGKLICISFSPTDLSIIKGAPQGRRRFLDKIIVELNPHMLTVYGYYQRALQSKQALLRSKDPVQVEAIDPWNQIMATYGAKIIFERKRIIEAFLSHLRTTTAQVASHDGEVALSLESEFAELQSETEIAERFQDRLREVVQHELHSGISKIGPHKDDFVLELDGKDTRAFASQGQTRSLVIGLKLACLHLIEELKSLSPLLLLDDLDSELDQARLGNLFELLFSHDRQTFITGTETPNYIKNNTLKHRDFSVRNGEILT